MNVNFNSVIKQASVFFEDKRVRRALFFLFFGLIIFLSIFPRAVEILANNYLFLIDQGRDYMAVKDIVINHKFTLIGSEIGGGFAGTQGIFQGPVYYYLLSIFFVLFKGNPYGGMIMMFMFSMASIIFAYFFARTIFKNQWAGALMAFFIAISSPLIDQARFIWNNHPSTFFIFLAFYFTYKAFKKDKKYLFLAAFFSVFVYNFEIAMAVPMCVALLFYVVFILKLNKVKEYLSLFMGFVLGILPMLLFEVRHNFIGTRGIINYVLVQPNVYLRTNAHDNLLNNHISTFVSNFLNTFTIKNIPPYSALLFLAFIALLVFLTLREKEATLKNFLKYLFITLLVTVAVLSLLRNFVYYYYLYHLDVIYIFIATYIIYKIFKGKSHLAKLIAILAIAIFLLTSVTSAISMTIKDYPDLGGAAKIKGQEQAIDYIYKDAKGKPFGLYIFTPPVYTYPYDYLLWWYAKPKYHYFPYQEKKGTFYLLMQVDMNQPWTYKGWMETVIKTGKIIDTKTLIPSGFIVQKRQA